MGLIGRSDCFTVTKDDPAPSKYAYKFSPLYPLHRIHLLFCHNRESNPPIRYTQLTGQIKMKNIITDLIQCLKKQEGKEEEIRTKERNDEKRLMVIT